MIKVLDARSVNGQFWVFFGALSSVQYSVTVADRFTGAFRKYSNPSGNFASVGDTEAFSGGQTVTPVADATHAVSANFDATGGSVSATGADGTVFTLELPPDALPVPQTVTLTPVSSLGRVPFSGGLVAGVEIEPDGLDLCGAGDSGDPATFALPSPEQTLPYSYARGGEDFILYPRDLDTSSLRLPLVRFGGYGVAKGSLSDAETQAERADHRALQLLPSAIRAREPPPRHRPDHPGRARKSWIADLRGGLRRAGRAVPAARRRAIGKRVETQVRSAGSASCRSFWMSCFE